MSEIQYQTNRSIPVIRDVDVVVIGGGPGGIGAATLAARQGVRSLLVERYGFLGGMATVGEVHPFMPNHINKKELLDRLVYPDWVRAMRSYFPPDWASEHPLDEETLFCHPDRTIIKEAAMLGAEDVVRDAGAEILYHHTLADVMVQGRNISVVILLSKSGLVAVRAKRYIDCTGDGDLAALAGCQYEQGGPSGHCQPMTTCFKLAGVDQKRFFEASQEGFDLQVEYIHAQQDGTLRCPRENILRFPWVRPDVVHFNTTRVLKHSATNGEDLSEAEIEARDQIREFIAWFRKTVPGYENAWLHSMGHHIGLRESRRILGRAYVTREDYDARRKFEDAVLRVEYPIDIHNPVGGDTEIVRIPPGEWYEIPYGCLVPRDRDNLFVAGRPISVDHAVHSSVRIMPPAVSLGQAAGLAAAESIRAGVCPGELNGERVRACLRDLGAAL